ncbi:hypothetical protein EPO34_01105 [Patescibacteria group bacterium]|nr:MAG: hypothetical protein EPO34_01105 [Patescibacteria group bacterium]
MTYEQLNKTSWWRLVQVVYGLVFSLAVIVVLGVTLAVATEDQNTPSCVGCLGTGELSLDEFGLKVGEAYADNAEMQKFLGEDFAKEVSNPWITNAEFGCAFLSYYPVYWNDVAATESCVPNSINQQEDGSGEAVGIGLLALLIVIVVFLGIRQATLYIILGNQIGKAEKGKQKRGISIWVIFVIGLCIALLGYALSNTGNATADIIGTGAAIFGDVVVVYCLYKGVVSLVRNVSTK